LHFARSIPRLAASAAVPLALACTFALAGSAAAQTMANMGPVDGKDLVPTEIERVAVGAKAPDFMLHKYEDGMFTLSSAYARKNVVLVFYRGYWCPYCVNQLKELRTLLDAPLKENTELVVVSIDSDKETKMAIARIAADGTQPDFTFLSDPDHAVIARYGVLNPSGSRRGIPHPATYVIDKTGVVRWRDVQTDYKIRPTNADILTAVKALGIK
jgi:peroxiredoxin